MRISIPYAAATFATLAVLAAAPALAEDPQTFEITIQHHVWTPSEIHVPAGKRVIFHVKNLDDTAEEFDSTALKVEKVIAGGGEGAVRIRALEPGRYPFMGEYHADTAQGVVIVE
jgi:plastocyanin